MVLKVMICSLLVVMTRNVVIAGVMGITPSPDTVLVVGEEYKFSASYMNEYGKGQAVVYCPVGGNSMTGMEAGWQAVGSKTYRITSLGNGKLTAQWNTGGVPNEIFDIGDVVYNVTDRSVLPRGLFFNATGGTGTIVLRAASTVSWNVVNSDPEWVSVDRGSGQGSCDIKVTVKENPTPDTRTANIKVAGSVVVVTQDENTGLQPEIKCVLDEPAYVVSILWPSSWRLFYTLDGSAPNENSILYEEPIRINRRGAKQIKAVAISSQGKVSEVSTLYISAPNPPTISPTSGTVISSSVSVNIASDNPNATIHCTTDGTVPTTDSPVYSRFKASKKMTVKAIAVVDGMAWSETATAEYALGQCADPTITPADGAVFDNSNYQVSIAKNGEKGVLRYTTDGSDPTEASPIYEGPFTINVTTTVKAKTFDSEYFDSAIVSATLARHWTKVATPIIDAVERFSGTKTSVSLSCGTEGAVIRYTTDGSEPNSHSPKYTGVFEVTATTVIKAIAFMADCENSDVATLTITREWGVGDALNDPDRSFVTDNSTGWMRDTAISHDGNESMRSGAIANSITMGIYSTSTLSTVVDGKGVVRFVWKASCEEDEEFEWDHGEFQVDGVMVARINGETGWEASSYEIKTDGNHVLSWIYFKDDFGLEGDDCIWLDEFNWAPPPAALSSLLIEGDERVVDGRENIYSCMANYDDGTSFQVSPEWTIASGGDCVAINSAGILTAKKVGKAVVSATYTDAGVTKTTTKSVTIVKGLSSVEIIGPASVYAGDSAAYSCIATYTDGSKEVVNANWTLMSGSGCATLNSAGTLTALDADGTAMIKVSFAYEGETKTATYSVGVSQQILAGVDVTGGSAAFVPVSWVNQYPSFRTLYGSDLVAAMAMLTGKKDGSGKQLNVWHDYVAGTDPTDVNDVFQAIIEFENGLPKVGWRPNLNEKDEVRTYRVYGRRSLSNENAWEYPANSAEHQFFKVDVSMPGTGDGGSDAPGVIEAWKFVAIPTAVSGLMYDGTTKQGVLLGTGYMVSGASAIGAGNYTAVATLASGFKWESGSQANQQIPWSIAKANNVWVSVPTMSATTFLAGSAVTVTDGVSKFGTITRNYSNSAIQSLSAGSYTLVSTVSGTANYTGLTHSIPFTVTAPATKIALPSAKTGLVYTGSTQTGVATGTGYTLSGNTGVNAGTYTATATLKSGYEWSDGASSQSRTISWSIAKATNSWLTQPSLSSTEFEEGSTVTISMGSVKFGVKQANYTATELAQLAAGSYTLVVSVTGTDNYTGLTKSIAFTVTAKPTVSNLYCVVDLSAGASAKSYPVEYVDAEPSEGWGDVHKTTKLVLRRVEKGSFSMMSKGKTSISKDYYIGVFEVTQKQYELVMGTNPANSYGVGDALPVYKVSYDDIRGVSAGAGWPTSSAVDGESFLGKLRARTSIDFDLPTEAQWEYACRAGTTGKYYWTEAGLATSLCAWYVSNSGYVTHNVGTKRSNDWGIFDMSGNVSEWCRDWYSSTLAYGNDPKGAASASYNRRVTRGGCYSSGESDLRMDDTYYRSGIDAATQSSSTGFRLVMSE